MRLKSLSVCGFRGFNDAQTLDLTDPLVVFEGPNGSGKTSIGEAVEWLLYGRTLKRIKGEDLSKREYNGCYRNSHFGGPGLPYVEVALIDANGKDRKIRRELNADETSILKIDDAPATDLKEFGVGEVHDRPLILQHTLQDFIFMKPKARYEVLSAMLGLEPLIALRGAIETAKTEFSKKLPTRAQQAQSRRNLLLLEVQNEPVLKPVAALVNSGVLPAAKAHLEQVAQGLVPSGSADLLQALKATKAAKERAQLDWGRFSGGVISTPATSPILTLLASLDQRIANIHSRFAAAIAAAGTQSKTREQDPNRRQFYHLGLELLDAAHLENCPFCAAASLTPERVAAIREAIADTEAGATAIEQARAEVRGFLTDLTTHGTEMGKAMPTLPDDTEVQKIRDIAGASADAFIASSDVLKAQLATCRRAYEELKRSRQAIEDALTRETVPAADDLVAATTRYKVEVSSLPALVNAYAANYTRLDPTIKAGLASSADVKTLERTISAIEQWKDVQIAQAVREMEQRFSGLIDDVREFTKKKQTEVLASRDQEIKDWYAILNPASDVAYDGMIPTTDNLELRARTYKKTMFAAPNLSMSQLNCVGLAVYIACATRPGTPFKTLLIDDPVQSMDDEHTEAFKKQVIEKLLNAGFHIVLLTHMHRLAEDVASLYRARGAELFKMSEYSISGPSIDWKGPEITRLLEAVRKAKDGNDQYRKQATRDLRYFVERFAKDLFMAQTKNTISKRYEDKSWGELRDLLRRCPDFDPKDEPKLEDTFNVMSRHMHPDDTMPQPVLSSAPLTSHYKAMSELLDRYRPVMGL